MKFHTKAIMLFIILISNISCTAIKPNYTVDKQNSHHDTKKEVKELEQNIIYSSCIIVLQAHIKQDYKNIANIFYVLGHLDNQQLFEKYVYENIEHCSNTINKADAEYIVVNINNEEKFQSKIPSYVLASSVISQKLSNPALTTSQTQLKNFIAQGNLDVFSLITSAQKVVNNRLTELLSGSPKLSDSEKTYKYSDAINDKKYKIILWTAVLIGVTIVATVIKITFDKKKKKLTHRINRANKGKKSANQGQNINNGIQEAKKSNNKKTEPRSQDQQDNSKGQATIKNEDEDDYDGIDNVFNALRKKQPVNKIIGVKSKTEESQRKTEKATLQAKKVEPVMIAPITPESQENSQENSSWVVITKSKNKKKEDEKAGRVRSRKNKVEDIHYAVEETKIRTYVPEDEKKVANLDEWITLTQKKPKKH